MSPHRHHWLIEDGLTFLNHGAFGACPRVVVEEQARLRLEMERNPLRFLWREIEPRLDAARAELAEFLCADADDLAFVTNATAAVNAVVHSLNLAPGDELLTTDHAYNACRNVLDAAAQRTGARVVAVPVPFPIASPEEVASAVLAGVSGKTRFAMLDHVTSVTALIFPIEKITTALEGRGIPVLVDGAHAPGMVPLNLGALGASWYAGNLHKWVCAPRGAAFLHARRDRQSGVHPVTLSHGYNTPRAGRSVFHDLFDWQGTLDVTAWLAVPAALQFCASLLPGFHVALMEENHALIREARAIFGVAPCPDSMLGSMATLPLPGALHFPAAPPPRFDPLQTRLLEEFRIEVPVVRFGGRRWFRISAHAHNCRADYERLRDVLAGISGEASRNLAICRAESG